MPRIPTALARLLARPPSLPNVCSKPLSALTSSFQRSLLPRVTPSIPSLLFRHIPQPSILAGFLPQVQLRFAQRGMEYQPSQRVRKRRHGFLARKRTPSGRKVIAKRREKKRHFLTH
ncbi:ribosomal protein L34-domain-containing protein [Pterulicium gracile]|uniref:Large ribosomal subunit protein bL34m n=1 Tax=Pterulicium gracile TaxID=1884261 RepID=A0A5C3QFJ2_9AGAR|nr:ribosomal protein L34-domain-containing protein [Pterula gracilis]